MLGAEFDALLQKNYEAGVFDCSVLVAKNNQVILSKGYGFADREKKIPNTDQTKFRLASLSKQFAAVAILLLQEQGKLNVQDKLCDYITNCPEDFKPITLHHMLTHSAGLPAKTRWDQPGDQMLPKGASLYFTPGEKWWYTDVGYYLAGRVVETVSGQSYEAFLQQNIFKPLQMLNTGYDHQQSDLAKGYSTGQGLTALASPGDYYAAGSIYSTVEDLYRYDQALFSRKLLPQPALSAMFSTQIPILDELPLPHPKGWGYGYGWFIGPEKPHLLYFHGGQYSGYRTAFWRYPEEKITIIQLCNQEKVMLVPTEEAIADKLLGIGN